MKLNIKIHNTKPRNAKIRLDSELAELIDCYLQFYQQELNASIAIEQAIIQMLHAFIRSDRSFMQWYRNKKNENQNE